jgi:O-succinylbenzoate synthase
MVRMGMVIGVARWRSRLRTPMRYAGTTFVEREGAFVLVEGALGRGIGEIAPLAGAHRETLDECLEALAAIDAGRAVARPPSLAFALDTAQALADGAAMPSRPLRSSVGVNALVVDDGDEALIDGARTIKVKIGRGPQREERDRLLRLAAAQPRSVLRLDGNRSLSLEACIAILEGLDPARIDYLEEPLADPLELPALHHATGMSIALDESLHEPEHRSLLETAPGVVAHVVKPSLVGDLGAVRARAERTARQGLRTTITTSFESSYSVHLLARIATWLPAGPGGAGDDPDHGLGTSGLLLDDPCDPAVVVRGRLAVDGPMPTPRVRFEPPRRSR